jgi:hypothetical protein
VLGFWCLFGEPVAEDGEGEPKAEVRVGDDDAGEDEDAEAGEQDEAGIEASSYGAKGAAAEAFEGESEAEDGEGEGKARGGGVDAEEFVAEGHAPVEERGFFEVADAVGVEGDPVVAEEHLAGDFGVDGVGVVEERRGDEGEADVEDEPEGDEDQAVAVCGRDGGWNCGLHCREKGSAVSKVYVRAGVVSTRAEGAAMMGRRVDVRLMRRRDGVWFE